MKIFNGFQLLAPSFELWSEHFNNRALYIYATRIKNLIYNSVWKFLTVSSYWHPALNFELCTECNKISGFTSVHNLLDFKKFFINFLKCIWFWEYEISRFLQFLYKLKLVSAIFYQMFIFSSNDSKNYEKCFLFHIKSSFRSRDIQIFVIFSVPFHTFQIQKGKWKWNNLCRCNF